MSYAPLTWPDAIAGSSAVAVIERAIARGRLAHGLLLLGEDIELLQSVAFVIADRLLNTPAAAACFTPDKHPDCAVVRPAGKMRQIGVDPTRDLISLVQVSPTASTHKVGVIVEADRMNIASSNIFLKTLEEPPRDTTLILISTRPYALLPTIRSRVQYFRFPTTAAAFDASGWPEWMHTYQSWLANLASSKPSRKGAAEHIMGMYGLVAQFSFILDNATDELWKVEKAKLPPDLKKDEEEAAEVGVSKGLRARMFADIEKATRSFAVPPLIEGDDAVVQPLALTVDALERCYGLLNVNLNESAALEDFLLATLRAWSRR